MDIRLESRIVQSHQEELARFQVVTATEILKWEKRLIDSPDSFFEIEQQIDRHFRNGASTIAAALLHSSSKTPELESLVESIREESDIPLRNPSKVSLVVKLLCGLVLEITTLYCPPTKQNKSETIIENRQGLYPELAAYGFAKGVSAALEDRVVRAAALYPSFEIAQRELSKEGLDLDVKTLRRIALQCGESLLASRREMVEAFFAGNLPMGNALTGKNVVVEEDGGRMRHRENIIPENPKPGEHPKFKAEWREPKLFIIYCVDENGKKEKDSEVWIDATFQGADHAAEMLAARLHLLGAAFASSVTFLADGANCLWDRFDWIVEAVGLKKDRVQFILDFFHASHHISLALKELGLEDKKRRDLYRELRHELRQSRWELIVSRLELLGADLLAEAAKEKVSQNKTAKEKATEGQSGASIFVRELNYLRKHGKAGHLSYVKYTRRGLPLGSGAVESAIRRVINLRLKSNGMFWTPENAEMILQLRCQLLSTQWDKCVVELRSRRRRTRSRHWRWNALDRSRCGRNVNTDGTSKPTKCRNSSIQSP